MNRGTSFPICVQRWLVVSAVSAAMLMSCGVAVAQDGIQAKPDTKVQPKARQQTQDVKPATYSSPKQVIPEPTVELKPGEVPAIKFDVSVFNFGRVMAGKAVEYEYYFTNPGNGPLEILKVRPGCSCTLAGDYTKIVKPGETGKIPVKLDTSKLAGRKTSKSIVIYTNIPGPDKEVRLTLVGDVWLGVLAEPQLVAFGSMTIQEAKQNPTRKTLLINNMKEPLKITNVQSTDPAFKPEIRMLEEGQRYELIVTLVKAEETGSISGSIVFDTGVAQLPKVSVPVRARINPPLVVVPGKIMVGVGRYGRLERKVTISNNTETPIEISDIKCSNEAIKVTFRELRPGKLFRLEVTLPEGYKPGDVEDTITFKTTGPESPEVTIPIKAVSDKLIQGKGKIEKAE